MGIREELLTKGHVEKVSSKGVRYIEDIEGNVIAKECTKCEVYKCIDDFYKNNHAIGKREARCRKCCSKAKGKAKRVALEERLVNDVKVIGKVCTKCDVWKPLDKYSNSKIGLGNKVAFCKECDAKRYTNNREEILQKASEYYRNNLDKKKSYDKIYYQENKEKLSEQRKKHYFENHERSLEVRRKWRLNNSEVVKKYRQDNREYYIKWYYENKDKFASYRKIRIKRDPSVLVKERINGQNRRAKKKLLPNTLTFEESEKILNHFNYSCSLTRDKIDYQLDHVVPIDVGHCGTIYENMVPLQSKLNYSKQSTNIFEWFEINRERFNLEQSRFDTLIEYLAKLNNKTVDEYRQFVYWCHENPNELDEINQIE